MNRLKYVFLLFSILFFSLIINVKAECSYEERKELLNDVKKVEIKYDFVNEEDTKYFMFTISNMSSNLFIEYTNMNNGESFDVFYNQLTDSKYTFIDNNYLMIYNYDFVFYSANDACPGYEITSKKILKPMFNIYSDNVNCSYEFNKNFKYCKELLTTDYKLKLDKFNDALVNYSLSLASKEETNDVDEISDSILNKILNYKWFIICFFVLILLIVFLIVKIRKKKNDL